MRRTNLKLVHSAPEKRKRKLTVRTVFYFGKKVVKKIPSGSGLNAVANCTKHMRRNTYKAQIAEVYDTAGGGKLYAVMRRSADGNLRTIFQRKLGKDE